jgi:hypothetical protein
MEKGAAMRCPYLMDTKVKNCRVSPVRKMIARTPLQADQEKCSSEDYASCALARQHRATVTVESSCPFLEELPAQFCAAAPVTKFIPCRDDGDSRCGGDDHLNCEFFLAREGH